MTFHRNLFFVFFFLVCAYSCGTMKHAGKSLSPKSYLEWYGSAACPLRDTVTAKEVIFVLQQVPVELELARYVQTNRMTSEEAADAYAESRKVDELTYVLTVELPVPGKDIFSFNLRQGEQSRKEYVSFGMKGDLFLVTITGDTIDCARTLYEQGISNSPRSRFIIDFTTITREKAAQLLFRDRLWSGQTIVFDLKENQQAVLPRLEL